MIASVSSVAVAFDRNALGSAVGGEPPWVECRTSGPLRTIFDRKFLGQQGELDLPMAGGPLSTGPMQPAIPGGDLEEAFERRTGMGTRFLSPPGDRIPLGRPRAFRQDADGRTVVRLGPRKAPRA